MSLKKNLTTVAAKKSKGGGLSKFISPSSKNGLAKKPAISTVSDRSLNILNDAEKNSGGDKGHLAYIIDATASRRQTWEEAQHIQAEMFREIDNAGESISARVISFGGGQVTDFGWQDKAENLINGMSKVNCSQGHTQIYDSVQKLLKDTKGHKPKNIIMIGDCCEETESTVLQAAYQLRAEGIKVFAFHEHTPNSHNPENGEKIYRLFAEITGGAFQEFGKGMKLKDLCSAVAAYTTGGKDGLKKLAERSKAALSIQNQLQLTHKSNKPASKLSR